jgi:hypothetical protein
MAGRVGVGGLVDVGDRGVVGHRGRGMGVSEEGLGLARVQAGFGQLGGDRGAAGLEAAVVHAGRGCCRSRRRPAAVGGATLRVRRRLRVAAGWCVVTWRSWDGPARPTCGRPTSCAAAPVDADPGTHKTAAGEDANSAPATRNRTPAVPASTLDGGSSELPTPTRSCGQGPHRKLAAVAGWLHAQRSPSGRFGGAVEWRDPPEVSNATPPVFGRAEVRTAMGEISAGVRLRSARTHPRASKDRTSATAGRSTRGQHLRWCRTTQGRCHPRTGTGGIMDPSDLIDARRHGRCCRSGGRVNGGVGCPSIRVHHR